METAQSSGVSVRSRGQMVQFGSFFGVIQNPHGAEVLRQAGCENFLTMGFSSPSGIKRAPGDLNCPPFVGQYTITFYINYICLFNYLFISSQMSAKPYFIGSTGILPLW